MQSPACSPEIPFMRETWLAKRQKIALRLIPNREAGRVDVEIVGQDRRPIDLDPEEETVQPTASPKPHWNRNAPTCAQNEASNPCRMNPCRP